MYTYACVLYITLHTYVLYKLICMSHGQNMAKHKHNKHK